MAKERKKKSELSMTGPSEKPVPSAGGSEEKQPEIPRDTDPAGEKRSKKSAETAARVRRGAERRRGKAAMGAEEKFTWTFGKRNLYLFIAGIVVILLGYVALAQPPYDSFWSLSAGPVLLVIGYLVIIPIAILIRERTPTDNET